MYHSTKLRSGDYLWDTSGEALYVFLNQRNEPMSFRRVRSLYFPWEKEDLIRALPPSKETTYWAIIRPGDIEAPDEGARYLMNGKHLVTFVRHLRAFDTAPVGADIFTTETRLDEPPRRLVLMSSLREFVYYAEQ